MGRLVGGARGGGARDREMRIYTLIHAYCISFHVQKCHISFSLSATLDFYYFCSYIIIHAISCEMKSVRLGKILSEI